jgi:hypothetical protein
MKNVCYLHHNSSLIFEQRLRGVHVINTILKRTGYKKVNDLPVSLTIEVETIDLIPPW